jgi:hypothetical protein
LQPFYSSPKSVKYRPTVIQGNSLIQVDLSIIVCINAAELQTGLVMGGMVSANQHLITDKVNIIDCALMTVVI